jgi:hypothetical protein
LALRGFVVVDAALGAGEAGPVNVLGGVPGADTLEEDGVESEGLGTLGGETG